MNRTKTEEKFYKNKKRIEEKKKKKKKLKKKKKKKKIHLPLFYLACADRSRARRIRVSPSRGMQY